MGEEDNPPPPLNDRIDHKRKHDDIDDLPPHDRKLGFSSSSSVSPAPERVRKTGFSSTPPPPLSSNDLLPYDRKPGLSGPPPGPYDRKTGFSGPLSEPYDRKTGFSGPPSESYDRKTGFSTPPAEQFERKSGFSGPNDPPYDVKTGFSGPPGGDFQRKTGFSGIPSGEYERKTGFSGPHGGDVDRKTGYSSGDYERKSGFSGPHHGGDMDRKTGFSDSGHSSALSDFEVAKQKAEQIAARLVAQDAKRPHGDEDGDDRFSGKFHSSSGGYGREDHGRGQMFQDHSQVHHHSDDRGGNFYNAQGYPQSKKMDIPNGRVGVVIGKGGETIKYLQQQSGAKIQITRDSEHDPSLPNRQVEIMGTAEQINRAEQMVRDVLAEAEAGGPAHFMGSGSSGSAAYGEPIQLKVPTNKVGLIIGRGGDTIRNLQSQSGARIQLVASSAADYGEERVLTLVGSKQQTDLATDLIKEVINESRSRGPPGGYNQGFRPPGPPQWGPPRGHQGSFPGPPQGQQFSGYGQQPPPQPYGGGYGHQTQQSSSSQHNAPQTQSSYGGHGQQPPSQDYSSQPPQYGGFPQRGPAPSPSQQTSSQGYYNQPPATSPSGNNSSFNQHQGGYNAQAPYGQQQPQGYGQQPSMIQSPGQHTSQQPYASVYGQPQQSYTQAYGQPSSGYNHPGFQPPTVPQASTEQGAVSTPGYGVPGSAHSQDTAKQPGFNQYGSTNQQAGYGQTQVPSYNQLESASSYGQGSFQPGYPPQEDSTGSGGSSQAGYGQAQPGYSTQGSLPANYGQIGSYGQQSSIYGASQPGSRAVYGTQGSMQPPPNYTQGPIPPQSGYAHPSSAQQGYMQGSSTSYGSSFDDQSQGGSQHAYNQGEVTGAGNNGGLDSGNVSVAPSGVSSTTEG